MTSYMTWVCINNANDLTNQTKVCNTHITIIEGGHALYNTKITIK